MKDKTILITGGTGSLGQAFTRIALEYNPVTIRIFSRGEYLQWEMQKRFNDPRLRFLIGDVRDKERIYRAMNGVDIVIHAAALKQVPTCEYNPMEAVKTNILGSINVIDAAIDNKVERVLAISSDKAVHPLNLYGATKLVMEKLFIQANISYGNTRFSCVRYGNFEGSRGSIIPLWEEQARQGEISITDPQMSRFWISLDDVSKFIIRFLGIMRGGEIFVPKMMEEDLLTTAQKIAPCVARKIIGKRGGEKLREILFAEGENPIEYKDYFVIK